MAQLRDNNGNRLDYITVVGHTSDRDGYNTVYAKVGSDVVRITLDEPFFDVFNIDIPNEVVEGDSFTVSADIDNSDGRKFEQTIEYSVDGTVEDSTIEELENESRNVSFSDVINSPGSYTLEISSDDDSMSGVLDVLEEAYFSVYGISAPSTVEEDESFSVSATVENTGEASDTQSISYNRGGSTWESLSGGQSTSVSFSDSISTEGTYTLIISSDDDSDSTSITVEAAMPDSDVYLQDDWGDNKLQDRNSVTTTYNGVEGVYRPDWTIDSGSPEASDESLKMGEGDEIRAEINLNFDETITWELTGLDVISDSGDGGDQILIPLFSETSNSGGSGFEGGYTFVLAANSFSRLQRVDGPDDEEFLIEGSDDLDGLNSVTITREPDGEWEYIEEGSSQGTATDTTYESDDYCGFRSRRDIEWSLDEIKVS